MRRLVDILCWLAFVAAGFMSIALGVAGPAFGRPVGACVLLGAAGLVCLALGALGLMANLRRRTPDTIELWVARDQDCDGRVWGYLAPPTRLGISRVWWAACGPAVHIDDHITKRLPGLASLRWEDKPIRMRVEVLGHE